MAHSSAKTVAAYLDELPPERRAVLKKVRAVIKKHLQPGFKETMGFGMISYGIPLSRFSDSYNKEPLCYAALAAQKNYFALYLMSAYTKPGADKSFREAYAATGKKLDMGKSCVRFKSLDDLPLDLIAKTIAATSVDEWIDVYQKSRPASRKAKK
jgi:uncharacterized protein YdhG (YjbR/CyaY superfamily)